MNMKKVTKTNLLIKEVKPINQGLEPTPQILAKATAKAQLLDPYINSNVESNRLASAVISEAKRGDWEDWAELADKADLVEQVEQADFYAKKMLISNRTGNPLTQMETNVDGVVKSKEIEIDTKILNLFRNPVLLQKIQEEKQISENISKKDLRTRIKNKTLSQILNSNLNLLSSINLSKNQYILISVSPSAFSKINLILQNNKVFTSNPNKKLALKWGKVYPALYPVNQMENIVTIKINNGVKSLKPKINGVTGVLDLINTEILVLKSILVLNKFANYLRNILNPKKSIVNKFNPLFAVNEKKGIEILPGKNKVRKGLKITRRAHSRLKDKFNLIEKNLKAKLNYVQLILNKQNLKPHNLSVTTLLQTQTLLSDKEIQGTNSNFSNVNNINSTSKAAAAATAKDKNIIKALNNQFNILNTKKGIASTLASTLNLPQRYLPLHYFSKTAEYISTKKELFILKEQERHNPGVKIISGKPESELQFKTNSHLSFKKVGFLKKEENLNTEVFINNSNIIKIEQTLKNIINQRNFNFTRDNIVPNPVELNFFEGSIKIKLRNKNSLKNKININNNIENKINNNLTLNKKNLNYSPFTYSNHFEVDQFIDNMLSKHNNIISISNVTAINQYIKSMTKYNIAKRGIFLKYSKILGFNFNYETNNINKNINIFITAFFKGMNCLISKPTFIITPDKITLQLFYFLCIPKPRIFKLYRLKLKMAEFDKKKEDEIKKREERYNERREKETRLIKEAYNLDLSPENLVFRKTKKRRKLLFKGYKRQRDPNTGLMIAFPISSSMGEVLNNRWKKKGLKRMPYMKWRARRALNFLINKTNKVRNKLIRLNKTTLINNSKFKVKFKFLCNFLSKLFNKPVELNLIRLHKPYFDSNILVNLLAIFIKKKNIKLALRKVYGKKRIRNLNRFNYLKKPKYADITVPAFISGLKVKVGGRQLREPMIPKRTVQKFEKGASANGKVNFLDVSRLTKSNRKGAYSITVSTGQNFF